MNSIENVGFSLEPVVTELSSPEEVKQSTLEILAIIDRINRKLTEQEEDIILEDVKNLHQDPEGFNCSMEVFHTKSVTYTDQVTCYEKAEEICFKTQKIDFAPQPMVRCHDNYIKECRIKYRDEPRTVRVKECVMKPYINCALTEEERNAMPKVCNAVNETVCSTDFIEKDISETVPNCQEISMLMCSDESDPSTCINVPQKNCSLTEVVSKKVFPVTKCEDVERKFCSPPACGEPELKEVCNDIEKTPIHSVPFSECSLEKREICNTIQKLLPKLVEQVNCEMSPRTSCDPSRILPKTVDEPVIKKVCRMTMR